ncbi:MAG: PAS domain S-box protein [Holophagaceae bacterium]|nr:PAS domain S-box protein [Holophagaceae bacterium]
MVRFNTTTNEILLKIVYYGPGLSGKTANLQALHAMCKDDFQGEFFSVNTKEDRTLFFDLLPINLGAIFGSSIHIQLYTVPGQPQYDATRRVILDGTDGVVFVADSSESKIQENIDSLTNMFHNLNANMIDVKSVPFVIQYNKRDLPNAMPVGLLNRKLNFRSVPFFETVAITGDGILETFVAIAKETVASVFKKHQLENKVKNFRSFIENVEANIRSSMDRKSLPKVQVIQEKTTVLRQENTSIDDLPVNRQMDPVDLLTDSLSSSMETARLYADLKKTMEGMEESNQDNLRIRKYMECLIQSLDVAIISFDKSGGILTCNPAAESIIGMPHAEIQKANIRGFMSPAAQDDVAQAVHSLLQGLPVGEISSVLWNERGKGSTVSMTIAPVLDENKKILAFSLLLKKLPR